MVSRRLFVLELILLAHAALSKDVKLPVPKKENPQKDPSIPSSKIDWRDKPSGRPSDEPKSEQTGKKIIKIPKKRPAAGTVEAPESTTVADQEWRAEAKKRKEAVKQIAKMKIKANRLANPSTGMTVLMEAVARGEVDSVRSLIDQGADLNIKDKEGKTALMFAVWKGDPLAVELLLKAGAKIHEETPCCGTNALMEAAVQGQTQVIGMILDAGANVTSTDKEGWDSLMLAAYSGEVSAVKRLLEAGADAGATSKDGSSALSRSLLSNQNTLQVVKTLLHAGADPNQVTFSERGRRKKTPHPLLMKAVYVENAEVVKELLRAGASVETLNHNGQTALLKAAGAGHLPTVMALLTAHAKVNSADRVGHTPLMFAASLGHDEVVNALIEAGANVNSATYDEGSSVLMQAASAGRVEVVKLLLRAGAKKKATDNEGRTAADHAALMEHREIMKLLS